MDNLSECLVRVLIADDQSIVRKGIAALLSTEPGIEVVGEARDGREAVELAQALRPDVVLMDLIMPQMDGIEAITQLIAVQPNVHILVLTSFASIDMILPAIRAGALGYLLKDSSPSELVEAIHQVHCGNASLHPAVARKLLQQLSQPDRSHSEPTNHQEALTEREVHVLKLVAQGYSNQEIADHLSLSEATVRTHVSHILAKLELSSRTQAALYALRKGWVSLQEE